MAQQTDTGGTIRPVRITRAFYDQSGSRQITLHPVLSYLRDAPLGVAVLTEDQALDLAQSLIEAVQTRRRVEAQRNHRRRPPELS